ncbi:FtsH protease activity modulator HflK [Derxia lacustris]|uniref:FtsH protease activity modulator HflK n=1 Tax=Derxia lacustris TaxID=764842 RepID=UPI000A1756E3|nr:FtsH protease activity modulator HflK [Derxia lacustris]
MTGASRKPSLALQDNSDPGGRRPDDGPPDLEELWRNVNRRISALFGKPGAEPPSAQPGPSGVGGNVGIGLAVGAAALIWLASGFYIVPEGQQSVTTTFGEYSSTSSRAGLQWRLPYPIQAHELVNVAELRTVEVGYRGGARTKILPEALMLTDDENIIDIQFAVQYRIREDGAADFVFQNRGPEDAVKQAAETSMRAVVGRQKMDSVLYEGRADVAEEVRSVMQGILDRYKTGILVQSVAIQQAQPPEQVQSAFDDAVKAGQDRERQINEGQAYANDVIPKARGAASRLTQEAEGYRQRVVETATGDAARFKSILAEYNRAPTVMRDRMYIDAMQQIYQNTSKLLVDTRGSSPLLYLPLEQLMRQTQSDPARAAASGSSPAGASAPQHDSTSGDSRSRDLLRARERDSR